MIVRSGCKKRDSLRNRANIKFYYIFLKDRVNEQETQFNPQKVKLLKPEKKSDFDNKEFEIKLVTFLFSTLFAKLSEL